MSRLYGILLKQSQLLQGAVPQSSGISWPPRGRVDGRPTCARAQLRKERVGGTAISRWSWTSWTSGQRMSKVNLAVFGIEHPLSKIAMENPPIDDFPIEMPPIRRVDLET